MSEKNNNEPQDPKDIERLEKSKRLSKEHQKILDKLKEAFGDAIVKDEKYVPGEFDADFMKLYMDEPFFAGISMEITKIPDTRMPTAYIGVRPNSKSYEIVMGFNPKFFRLLTPEQRQNVIKHEIYHMVFHHIFARSVGDKNDAQLHNWATDCSINTILGKENLPNMCIVPGYRPINSHTKKCVACNEVNKEIEPIYDYWICKYCEEVQYFNPLEGEPSESPYAKLVESFKPNLSSDYYYKKLKEEQEKQGDSGGQMIVSSGMNTLDDHDMWDKIPGALRDEINDKVRDLVERGILKAERDNSWGNVPQEVQDLIKRMYSRQIDWRSIVKSFVGRVRTTERTSTVRKVNKKMPYIHPGTKRKTTSSVAAFIDQSGSMSNEDIAQLFSELEGLSRYTEIDVFNFDTEIDFSSHFKWKKGDLYPTVKRTRCGGTSFDCIAEYCNKPEVRGKYSGIIVLTDGYASGMPQIVGSKVLWVITSGGTTGTVREGDLVVQMDHGDGKFKSRTG